MSAKRNDLISARRVTVYINIEGKELPCLFQFDYFFETPVNQIEIQKFLSPLIKSLRLSIKGWRFGPTRRVASSRIWSRRKIEEDVLSS